MSIDYTPNNTFIFCFVRMNPPTPGHLSLIGGMINKALELGTNKIFILTSSSMDGKNPVPCDTDANPITNRTKRSKKDDAIIARIFSEGNTDLIYKKKILDDMINSYKEKLIRNNPEKESQLRELKIIVVCSVGVPGNTIYSIIQKYFTEAEEESVPKINLIFFGGRDRADFVDQIIDNNKTRPYINSVDGEVMGREGMTALIESGTGERDVSDIKESEFSASYVRNLVNHKKKIYDEINDEYIYVDKTPDEIQIDEENFVKIYMPYLDIEDIGKLYKTILFGLDLKAPSSSDSDNPPTKYFTEEMNPIKPEYHMKKMGRNGRTILPIVNETLGGKKRNLSKRKIKRNHKKTRKYKKYSKRTY